MGNSDLIAEEFTAKIYTQSYASKPTIDGLKIVTLKNNVGEDSDFVEVMRLNAQGESELFPGFKIAQINYSTQFPGSVKAWHMHENQDEVWYVPQGSRLLAGFWDLRRDSPTKNVSLRLAMGGSSQKLVYIPHGVAHGSSNLAKKTGVIMYFMNNHFNIDNPDERRLPWNSLGDDFWLAQRD